MLAALQIVEKEEPHCVLLVEDDVLLRGLPGDTMREAGFTVIEASNADEALPYLPAGARAQLVSPDGEMPGSMDGIAFGRWVRLNHPEIQLILTSGKAAPEAAGLGHFIPKPYGIRFGGGRARHNKGKAG